MNTALKEIAVSILSAIAAGAIIVCATPYIMFMQIYEAYQEDSASSKLHQDIDTYLREQRGQTQDDDYGHYQTHAW